MTDGSESVLPGNSDLLFCSASRTTSSAQPPTDWLSSPPPPAGLHTHVSSSFLLPLFSPSHGIPSCPILFDSRNKLESVHHASASLNCLPCGQETLLQVTTHSGDAGEPHPREGSDNKRPISTSFFYIPIPQPRHEFP